MKIGEVSIIKIFFAISIVTFFVVFTIYILNLAQGRTFTREGEIVSTSILRIDSNPADVDILIDGKKVTLTENRIEGIKPGEITVTISKDGFSTWEKTLNITASSVKDIFVQLFPSDLNLTQFTNSNIDLFTYPTDSRYIYYSIIDPEIIDEAGLYRQRLTRNLIDFGDIRPEKIADFSESLREILLTNKYSLLVSDDNSRVLLNIPGEELLFSYNASTLNDRINIDSRLGFYPQQVLWHQGSDSIVVRNSGLIAEYFLNTNELIVIDFDSENTTRFAKAGNKIFFIRTRENLIYEYENKASKIFEFPKGVNIEGQLLNIFAPKQNKDIFILNISGDFFILDIEKKFFERISREISIKAIAPLGKTIIYQRGEKLYSYTLEDSLNQKSYNVTAKELDLLPGRFDRLFFSNTGSNLIVFTLDEEGKRSLSFRDTDGQNPVSIPTDESISVSDVLFTNDSKSLYILLDDSVVKPINEDITPTRNIYQIDLEVL